MPIDNVDFYSISDLYVLADDLAHKDKQTEILTRHKNTLNTHTITDDQSISAKHFASTVFDLIGVRKETFTVCQFVHACEDSGKLNFDDVLESWVKLAPNDLQKRVRPEVVKDITPLYHFNKQTIKHFKEALFSVSKTNPITLIETFTHKPQGHALNCGALKHARLNEYPIKFELPKFILSELVDGRVIS